MPGRNGTGPLGMGPLTGRGLGPCGRGYFSYRRPRLGYGRGYYSVNENTDRSFLEDEKAMLEARLKEINETLEVLDKNK